MNNEPRVLVLSADSSVSSLVQDIRASLSDSVVIDARFSDVLKNEADLRLLLHYAGDDGKRITIITRDSTMSALADQLGIEVLSELPVQREDDGSAEQDEPNTLPGESASDLDKHESVLDANGQDGMAQDSTRGVDQSISRYPGKSLRTSKAATRVTVLLASLALITTIVVVYVRSSRIEVNVIPATARVSEALIIGVERDGGQEPKDVLGMSIPSYRLSTEIEYSREMPTTGEVREGIAPAVGEVLLINSGLAPIRIPAKTKLKTVDGIEFETVSDVEVDPKTTMVRAGLKVGETSGTATVTVTAVKSGSSGNVPALSVALIDEPFSDLLQVTNENEFRGGRDRVIRVVSEGDAEQLRRMSEARMLEDGAAKLMESSGLDMYLLTPTLEVNVRSIEIYPDVHKESDRVSIQTSGTVEVEAVRFEDLSKAIGDKLSVSLGEGYALIADSLAIDSLSSYRLSSGQVAISLDVSATFRAEISPEVVAKSLAGEGFDEVRERLIGSGRVADLIVDEDIESFPRWPYLIRVVVSMPSGTN